MRSAIFITLCAIVALTSCGESGGGSGATGGSGASGGTGGMPACLGPEDCDDGDECTADSCLDAVCRNSTVADGTPCTGGECREGRCESGFACTEQGIRDAIAEGGGPHFFDCDGPTTVTTSAEIVIDNDVILDGESQLTVDAQQMHRVFEVAAVVTAELRGFTVTGGTAQEGGGVSVRGTLTLTDTIVSNNTADFIGGGIQTVPTLR